VDEIPKPRPSKSDEAEIALRAFDNDMDMTVEDRASGLLPREAARNFAMQAAIAAIDELRATGTATIYVREDGKGRQ
jgi:hypothetical protein